MIEPPHFEDVAVLNQKSLDGLVRAITLSQGQFSLILVRCNYGKLRQLMVQRLRELCPVEIREIVLNPSVSTLYTTIQGELGDEQPQTLMIFGLESVSAIEQVLTLTNQVREEFRKNFPFPLLLWINDEVLQKLIRLAPDFESWSTTAEFAITTEDLFDFLQQSTDDLFIKVLNVRADRFPDNTALLDKVPWPALNSALRDLQSQQVIKPELDASLQFVFGQYDYANDYIDSALVRYQKSLRFWRASNKLERQGAVLFYIGLCYCRNADLQRSQRDRYWEEAWPYLLGCIDVFEQAGRQDLVARFITQLVEVLERLKAWNLLQIWGQKAVALHENYGSVLQLAQDYGFLAEVALQQSRWEGASSLAQTALSILAEVKSQPGEYHGLHRFLLAQLYQLFLVKSQRELGQLEESHKHLETASRKLQQAIDSSDHRYEPQRYLHLLEELRTLYFEEGRYLEAFRLKQEQRATEQLYGLRAFIGAARLQPQRLITNPTLTPIEHGEMVAQEIAASGREQDVNRIIKWIKHPVDNLIIIHGQSGVGKSSLINAGLLPALRQRLIRTRYALPLTLQIYTDWVEFFGRVLAGTLKEIGYIESSATIDSTEDIIEQLRENSDNNILTILILDQFEDFFIVNASLSHRLTFYKFINECLKILHVKVILSMREDYLYYLLEYERLSNWDKINDILKKENRYYLGNFSLKNARSVIEKLTNRAHFYLETALLDELVQDLAGELGTVRPIELQVVGAQLQAENITTLDQYQKLGPKQKLVERFLEKVITDCGPENENSAWLVLSLLTDENENRPLRTRAELGIESGIESQELDLILEILEKSGLVFLSPEFPANRYQLIHDYLVEFIRMKDELNIQKELEELRQKDKQSQDKIEQLRAELTEKELIVRQKELLAKLAQATAQQRSTEEKLNQVLEQRLRHTKLLAGTFLLFAMVAGGLGLWVAISYEYLKNNPKAQSVNKASPPGSRPFYDSIGTQK